jgi:signal transduction histidine kinase
MLQIQLALEREVAHKSRMEELGQMAATVAHNVKNPLSSIRTLLQLQRESSNLTEEQQEELGMMIDEVDRLARTVTSLLRFSRLGNSDSGTDFSRVNLDTLVQSVALVYRGTVESGDLRMETDCLMDPPWLITNQESLQEIISNLLANAVEASPPGGRIKITVSGTADRAEITIQDEGPGIPDHLISKVFDPFFTTKTSGTGLGLAIVRRRVEQLGGSIRIERGVPSGTLARLEIPAAKGIIQEQSMGESSYAKSD